jgi:DNA-binding FadR family transcriptional regulator
MSNSTLPVSTLEGSQDRAAAPPRSARTFGVPVERRHASDQVFREVASAILNRELAPGSFLPPERELSERFGVSRIVVREAIHRLKEYELVRVRQGSPTLVLDPDRATDMRLLGLEIELVPPTPSGLDAFAERQVYSASALLDLAEQRMSEEELDELERLVREFDAERDREASWARFDRAFWTAIAKGTQNRIYLRETLWYFNLLERDPRFRTPLSGGAETRGPVYAALVRTLRARSGSAALYLSSLRNRRADQARA